MKSIRFAVNDHDRCVACGACVKECPRGALSVWRGCYAEVDSELCVGCGRCCGVCPVGCIKLQERNNVNEQEKTLV